MPKKKSAPAAAPSKKQSWDGVQSLRESKGMYLANFQPSDPMKVESYPFRPFETVLILGEIENMPEHVALATKDGKFFWGFHAEHFRRLTKLEA